MSDVSATQQPVKLNCPNCGARLQFSAAKQQLECTHCNTQTAVAKTHLQVVEKSLMPALRSTDTPVTPIQQVVYKCERCSTENNFTTEVTHFTCKSCGYYAINPAAFTTRSIQPAALIPFTHTRQQALEVYKKWVGQGFWAPGDLKEFARADALQGLYLPFWTYDAQTNSRWEGYGGRYYYVTEHYTDSQGRSQTRQVQHTEWIYRTGDFDYFFDDILIGASNLVPQQEYGKVFPYHLNELVDFDVRYLSGWQADVYDLSLNDGYQMAFEQMQQFIYNACADACRIDTYRGLEVNTDYSKQTYKHILLPLWVCTYQYKGKTRRFIINGQTGSIYGKKPVSASKVVVAVLLGILLILGIWFWVQSNQ